MSGDSKPEEVTPIDLALIARLLLQKADERSAYPSLGTLALELGCGESAISESVKRLKRIGWLQVESGSGRHRPNRYFVLLGALPVPAPLKTPTVTEDAKSLAKTYLGLQKQWQPKRIFRKGTEQRYAYRFQSLLKKCNGNKSLLVKMLNFALVDGSTFKSAALVGPHRLRKVWRSLERAYRESQGQKPPAQAAAA